MSVRGICDTASYNKDLGLVTNKANNENQKIELKTYGGPLVPCTFFLVSFFKFFYFVSPTCYISFLRLFFLFRFV